MTTRSPLPQQPRSSFHHPPGRSRRLPERPPGQRFLLLTAPGATTRVGDAREKRRPGRQNGSDSQARLGRRPDRYHHIENQPPVDSVVGRPNTTATEAEWPPTPTWASSARSTRSARLLSSMLFPPTRTDDPRAATENPNVTCTDEIPPAQDRGHEKGGPPTHPLQQVRGNKETADMSNPQNTEWMAHGNCRHVAAETMSPSTGTGVSIAQAVCAACPVRQTCLDYALLHRIDHGVWGGTRGARAATHSRRPPPSHPVQLPLTAPRPAGRRFRGQPLTIVAQAGTARQRPQPSVPMYETRSPVFNGKCRTRCSTFGKRSRSGSAGPPAPG